MRETSGNATPATLPATVGAAMSELEIDEVGTYYLAVCVKRPGKPDAITESVMAGPTVRALIRAQLRYASRQVSQDGLGDITVRWMSAAWQATGREKTCTYSKVC
ncbi:hypothetical protein ACFYSJ_05245 [Streptomyces sp. NPDC005248]|uniref:hypothetical protein n=1 Tax=Streptomyces sp. NPDC005248 TaxID=3364709 RepID=UPI00368CCBFC